MELDWQDEAFRRFWEALAEGYTLVRYDRLGVGMSDREGPDAHPTVDGEVALLRRVLDELELERVVLLGGSSGGCAAISFAARFPERVERLLLYGAYADGAAVSTPEVREAIVTTVRSHWGLGSRLLADIFLGTVGSVEQERLRGISGLPRARRRRPGCSSSSIGLTLGRSSRLCRRRLWSCTVGLTARSRMPLAASWQRRFLARR